MDFNEALKQAIENGKGTVIRDSAGRAWRVTDTGIEVVKPIKHDGCADEGCWTIGDDWHVEPFAQPQPTPEPELMTMAQAIAKAVEMGGGEIVGKISGCICAKVGRDIELETICPGDVTNGRNCHYTVRPLPPETFDFTEAMARLMKGESVQINDGHEVIITPEIFCKNGSAYSIPRLKDKTFRAAP